MAICGHWPRRPCQSLCSVLHPRDSHGTARRAASSAPHRLASHAHAETKLRLPQLRSILRPPWLQSSLSSRRSKRLNLPHCAWPSLSSSCRTPSWRPAYFRPGCFSMGWRSLGPPLNFEIGNGLSGWNRLTIAKTTIGIIKTFAASLILCQDLREYSFLLWANCLSGQNWHECRLRSKPAYFSQAQR